MDEMITRCKHATMKLDSLINDLNEMREEENIIEDERRVFAEMSAMSCNMIAVITNFISEKCGISEEEFIAETIDGDIEHEMYSEDDDLLDNNI